MLIFFQILCILILLCSTGCILLEAYVLSELYKVHAFSFEDAQIRIPHFGVGFCDCHGYLNPLGWLPSWAYESLRGVFRYIWDSRNGQNTLRWSPLFIAVGIFISSTWTFLACLTPLVFLLILTPSKSDLFFSLLETLKPHLVPLAHLIPKPTLETIRRFQPSLSINDIYVQIPFTHYKATLKIPYLSISTHRLPSAGEFVFRIRLGRVQCIIKNDEGSISLDTLPIIIELHMDTVTLIKRIKCHFSGIDVRLKCYVNIENFTPIPLPFDWRNIQPGPPLFDVLQFFEHYLHIIDLSVDEIALRVQIRRLGVSAIISNLFTQIEADASRQLNIFGRSEKLSLKMHQKLLQHTEVSISEVRLKTKVPLDPSSDVDTICLEASVFDLYGMVNSDVLHFLPLVNTLYDKLSHLEPAEAVDPSPLDLSPRKNEKRMKLKIKAHVEHRCAVSFASNLAQDREQFPIVTLTVGNIIARFLIPLDNPELTHGALDSSELSISLPKYPCKHIPENCKIQGPMELLTMNAFIMNIYPDNHMLLTVDTFTGRWNWRFLRALFKLIHFGKTIYDELPFLHGPPPDQILNLQFMIKNLHIDLPYSILLEHESIQFKNPRGNFTIVAGEAGLNLVKIVRNGIEDLTWCLTIPGLEILNQGNVFLKVDHACIAAKEPNVQRVATMDVSAKGANAYWDPALQIRLLAVIKHFVAISINFKHDAYFLFHPNEERERMPRERYLDCPFDRKNFSSDIWDGSPKDIEAFREWIHETRDPWLPEPYRVVTLSCEDVVAHYRLSENIWGVAKVKFFGSEYLHYKFSIRGASISLQDMDLVSLESVEIGRNGLFDHKLWDLDYTEERHLLAEYLDLNVRICKVSVNVPYSNCKTDVALKWEPMIFGNLYHELSPVMLQLVDTFNNLATYNKLSRRMGGPGYRQPPTPPSPGVELHLQELDIAIKDHPLEQHLQRMSDIWYKQARDNLALKKVMEWESQTNEFYFQKSRDNIQTKFNKKSWLQYKERTDNWKKNSEALEGLVVISINSITVVSEFTRGPDTYEHYGNFFDRDTVFTALQRLDESNVTTDHDVKDSFWMLMGSYIWVTLKCLKVNCRAFADPLVEVQEMVAQGAAVCAAHETVDQYAKFYNDFPLQHGEAGDFEVIGTSDVRVSYSTFKIFYDLELKVLNVSLSYAPCYNLTLFDILDTVTHRFIPGFIDPDTNDLQFWDMLRYILHGKLKCEAQDVSIQLLTAEDPQRKSKQGETVTVSVDFAEVEIDHGGTNITARQIEINMPDKLCKDDFTKIQHPLMQIPRVGMSLGLNWSPRGKYEDEAIYDHWVYPFKVSPSFSSLASSIFASSIPSHLLRDRKYGLKEFLSGRLSIALNLELDKDCIIHIYRSSVDFLVSFAKTYLKGFTDNPRPNVKKIKHIGKYKIENLLALMSGIWLQQIEIKNVSLTIWNTDSDKEAAYGMKTEVKRIRLSGEFDRICYNENTHGFIYAGMLHDLNDGKPLFSVIPIPKMLPTKKIRKKVRQFFKQGSASIREPLPGGFKDVFSEQTAFGILVHNVKFLLRECSGSIVYNQKLESSKKSQIVDSDVAVVELYENQRRIFGGGLLGASWSGNNLMLTDRGTWTCKDGIRYMAKDEINKEIPPGWEWTGPWKIDKFGEVDKDGWEYAVNFWHPWYANEGTKMCVRRRRWVRERKLKQSVLVKRQVADATYINPIERQPEHWQTQTFFNLSTLSYKTDISLKLNPEILTKEICSRGDKYREKRQKTVRQMHTPTVCSKNTFSSFTNILHSEGNVDIDFANVSAHTPGCDPTGIDQQVTFDFHEDATESDTFTERSLSVEKDKFDNDPLGRLKSTKVLRSRKSLLSKSNQFLLLDEIHDDDEENSDSSMGRYEREIDNFIADLQENKIKPDELSVRDFDAVHKYEIQHHASDKKYIHQLCVFEFKFLLNLDVRNYLADLGVNYYRMLVLHFQKDIQEPHFKEELDDDLPLVVDNEDIIDDEEYSSKPLNYIKSSSSNLYHSDNEESFHEAEYDLLHNLDESEDANPEFPRLNDIHTTRQKRSMSVENADLQNVFMLQCLNPQVMLESTKHKSCVVFGVSKCTIEGRWLWCIPSLPGSKIRRKGIELYAHINGIDGFCAPMDADPDVRPWIDRTLQSQNMLSQILNPFQLFITGRFPNRAFDSDPSLEDNISCHFFDDINLRVDNLCQGYLVDCGQDIFLSPLPDEIMDRPNYEHLRKNLRRNYESMKIERAELKQTRSHCQWLLSSDLAKDDALSVAFHEVSECYREAENRLKEIRPMWKGIQHLVRKYHAPEQEMEDQEKWTVNFALKLHIQNIYVELLIHTPASPLFHAHISEVVLEYSQTGSAGDFRANIDNLTAKNLLFMSEPSHSKSRVQKFRVIAEKWDDITHTSPEEKLLFCHLRHSSPEGKIIVDHFEAKLSPLYVRLTLGLIEAFKLFFDNSNPRYGRKVKKATRTMTNNATVQPTVNPKIKHDWKGARMPTEHELESESRNSATKAFISNSQEAMKNIEFRHFRINEIPLCVSFIKGNSKLKVALPRLNDVTLKLDTKTFADEDLSMERMLQVVGKEYEAEIMAWGTMWPLLGQLFGLKNGPDLIKTVSTRKNFWVFSFGAG